MLIYEDFVSKHYDALYPEDSRLSDLTDEALDEAIYIWLNSHKTWFDDIYPISIGRSVGKIVTEMLFGKKPINSKLISNLFIAMAEDCPDDYGREAQWWSEALGIHLDEIVNLGNFADDLRDRIYLYLESVMEEEIYDEFAKQKASIDREHGIYNTEVRGNC
jgi:hypothetical protein